MKNVPKNPKIKIVRIDRGKLRMSPKRPQGLPKTFKLNKLTQTSTFINMIMKTFYIPSKLEILFINLCINNMYFIKNLLIDSTLQSLMVQMGSVDRSILAPKPFRKSVRTFWTRLELPAIISDNFDFWVFGHIFHHFQRILAFELRWGILPSIHRHLQGRWRPYIARFWL